MDANKAEEINLQDWDIERVVEDECRDRYRAELKEATEELDALLKEDK